MSDALSLTGLQVAITGGAGDIGLGMARRLAADGARIVLLDRVPLEQTSPDVRRLVTAGSLDYHEVDVRDPAGLHEALSTVEPLDVMIANAGTVRAAPFLEITAEDWEEQISSNLTGAFHTTQTAARLMVQRGHSGHIILTSSWVQDVPWPEIASYAASKAGLRMLARSAARELAAHRIRVNVIAPGIVAAGLAKRQLETEPQYAARVARVIPLDRFQTIEDVAGVVAFLCSSDADYLTGSVLLADGGCSLFQFDHDG